MKGKMNRYFRCSGSYLQLNLYMFLSSILKVYWFETLKNCYFVKGILLLLTKPSSFFLIA